MSIFNPGWFVIYTRPRHEKKVEDQLKENEIKSFCPVKNEIRTWSDRKKVVQTPLFPSYIFVYIQKMEEYFTTASLEGVIYFLKSGKEVSRIDEKIINNIQQLVNFGDDLNVVDNRFARGQKLLIQKGPLTGKYCDFVEINGSKMAVVYLEILQRSITATLPPDYFLVAD